MNDSGRRAIAFHQGEAASKRNAGGLRVDASEPPRHMAGPKQKSIWAASRAARPGNLGPACRPYSGGRKRTKTLRITMVLGRDNDVKP